MAFAAAMRLGGMTASRSLRVPLLRPRSHRRLLSIHRASGDDSKFTLAVPPALEKEAVVKHLRELRAQNEAVPSTPVFAGDAAVVLATPTFTRWLTDKSFMSALLATFTQRDVKILAGVVDDLHAPVPSGGPVAGFSVLRGNAETLLPSFDTPAEPLKVRGGPRPGSLQFSLPWHGEGPLSLNMPLTNTVFQNGRDSTLLACTWSPQPDSSFALTHTAEKTRQEIALGGTTPFLSVPLIPVTPPRRILGCLGNIVSQIEVDGVPVPASTELENEVQGVYDRRAAAGNLNSEGMPVDIWAMVSTPESTVTPEIEDVLDSLEEAAFEGPEEEREVAARNATLVEKLLMANFQLHRITSGGGGWDKRRGRLSLDPTWSTSDPSPDETMILNIKGSGPPILQSGPISRGSYIQFLTCPNPSPFRAPSPEASVVLGTSATRGGEGAGETSGDVDCFRGYFGALSRRHFFLGGAPGTAALGPRVRTQVDTPFSFVSM